MTRAATVTAERIERALDGLAGIIAAAGEAGRAYLPIFARLERELVAVRADDATMSAAWRGRPERKVSSRGNHNASRMIPGFGLRVEVKPFAWRPRIEKPR